jgi:hypothetical protein
MKLGGEVSPSFSIDKICSPLQFPTLSNNNMKDLVDFQDFKVFLALKKRCHTLVEHAPFTVESDDAGITMTPASSGESRTPLSNHQLQRFVDEFNESRSICENHYKDKKHVNTTYLLSIIVSYLSMRL